MTNRHPLDGNMIAADRYYESQASIVDTCPDWVVTSFECPPIPYRGADWSAWDDRLGADSSLIGRGSTEEEAIEDLLEQLDM